MEAAGIDLAAASWPVLESESPGDGRRAHQPGDSNLELSRHRKDEPMSEPLTWGVIGTGKIAETFAADLRLTDSGRIAAVGSRQMDSANRFADRFDIPNRHASYEALMADPDVDVVYVATPHPLHYSGALLALHAGKPVLVEKPFTMNAREAQELVSTAR